MKIYKSRFEQKVMLLYDLEFSNRNLISAR